MQMVAADWIRSDKREDDLGGRPGGIVQVFFMDFEISFLCFAAFKETSTQKAREELWM